MSQATTADLCCSCGPFRWLETRGLHWQKWNRFHMVPHERGRERKLGVFIPCVWQSLLFDIIWLCLFQFQYWCSPYHRHTHTERYKLCAHRAIFGSACAPGGGPYGAGTKACNASQELIKLGDPCLIRLMILGDMFYHVLPAISHRTWDMAKSQLRLSPRQGYSIDQKPVSRCTRLN
jgi:hypothetical protein